MDYSCIIVASGKGLRLGLGYNKLLYKINEKTLLEYTIEPFLNDEECQEIIIVTNDIFSIHHEKILFIQGGETRSLSVIQGLKKVNYDYVMIHDGARCNLNSIYLEQIKKSLQKYDGCFLGSKVSDTMYTLNLKSIDRDNLIKAQTPQAFKTKILKEAYEKKNEKTDDISVFLMYNDNVEIILANDDNFKITTKNDLNYFKYIKNNLK